MGATTPEKENDIELITEDISSRKDEILQWYTKKRMPNEEFVIIDDDKMLNGLPENIKHNLVLTSPSIGLTDDLADVLFGDAELDEAVVLTRDLGHDDLVRMVHELDGDGSNQLFQRHRKGPPRAFARWREWYCERGD